MEEELLEPPAPAHPAITASILCCRHKGVKGTECSSLPCGGVVTLPVTPAWFECPGHTAQANCLERLPSTALCLTRFRKLTAEAASLHASDGHCTLQI